MTQPWHTDEQVTPELARHLIATQFPMLYPRHVDVLGNGWDNTAFLIDGSLVFRFPRK